MRFRYGLAASAVALLLMSSGATANEKGNPSRPPNVLIFLLDDTGFGQLGAFGGSINTPNIDRVAGMGLRYTNFHTTALCSPTRAALLTGRNHHSVGAGVIAELSTDDPGYTSHFPKDKLPIVEVFREGGYATAAFGKWHNTPPDQLGNHPVHDQWPTDVGFERFYGFLGGDSSQFEPTVWDDTRPIEPHVGNPNYHFGNDMTDKTLAWLRTRESQGGREPFFVWYAPGAMHAPHHPSPEYADKYRGQFALGWDRLREQTFARQKAMGLVPQDAELPPRPDEIPAWDSLSADEKRVYERMQEIFAGYLEQTDAQFGRVLSELERTGELDNTIVIVTSDNGASGEGGLAGSFNELLFFNGVHDDLANVLARIDELGTKTSYNHYPAGWALAGNTPFRYWKQTAHEGGVHDPLVIAWPAKIAGGGQVRGQFTHANDVMPTLLELAGLRMPAEIHGIPQKPMEGASFVASLADAMAPAPKSVQYFEMLANRGVWQDGWKAVTFHGRFPWDSTGSNPNYDADVWELYHLAQDPAEARNLAAAYPEKLSELKALFHQEALKFNVYPLDDTTGARMVATAAALTAGITNFEFQQGDVRISEPSSPPVKNRSHVIEAELTVPDGGADGVLVACGGRFGGYALFVHYVHNYMALQKYEIVASEQLPRGSVDVRFEFMRTGDNQGRGKLYVNGNEVATGDIEKTVPRAYGIVDTFDVGMDTGSPVTDQYAVPNAYRGRIERLEVIMADGPTADEAM
jgi:arylsulfatase